MSLFFAYVTFLTISYTVKCEHAVIGKDAVIKVNSHYKITQLSAYNGYSSVQMFHFQVPAMAVSTEWVIRAIKNNIKCPRRKIKFHLQHGGFPVIAPRNESFPPNFSVDPSHAISMETMSGNAPLMLNLIAPRPGAWFAAAYVETQVSQVIGIRYKVDCEYALDVSHTVDVLNPSYISVIDLPQLVPTNVKLTKAKHIYRFHVSTIATHLQFAVDNCQVSSKSVESCPVSLTTRGSRFPLLELGDGSFSSVVNCSSQTGVRCMFSVPEPEVGVAHYLAVTPLTNETVSFTLTYNMIECQVLLNALSLYSNSILHNSNEKELHQQKNGTALNNTTLYSNASTHSTENTDHDMTVISDVPVWKCHIMPKMDKVLSDHVDFLAFFVPNIGEFRQRSWLRLRDGAVLVLPFDIDPATDLGGTLRLRVRMFVGQNSTNQRITVAFCLQKDVLPIGINGSIRCDSSRQINLSRDKRVDKLYIPYPEAGHWFIAAASYCEGQVNGSQMWQHQVCQEEPLVNIDPLLSQCFDSGCAGHGDCEEFISHVAIFSSCQCKAGWRGYGCTDGTVALSESTQLAMALLLTLSNLFFIPAIVLALIRRYYVEAMVYFFNMFFSIFYHACDNASLHTYCMMELSVLSYCDFYGSVFSFWITLIAMAKLPQQLGSVLQMLGALSLALTIEWKEHNTWVQIVPMMIGAGIVLLSWSIRCGRRRKCYPSKRRYLFYLVPGLVLSGTALSVFAFFETDENYYLTHSAWHALIMSSVAFFLPPRKTRRLRTRAMKENSSPTTSEEDVCCETINLLQAEREDYDHVPEPNIIL